MNFDTAKNTPVKQWVRSMTGEAVRSCLQGWEGRPDTAIAMVLCEGLELYMYPYRDAAGDGYAVMRYQAGGAPRRGEPMTWAVVMFRHPWDSFAWKAAMDYMVAQGAHSALAIAGDASDADDDEHDAIVHHVAHQNVLVEQESI
jgi:hypothetical protein